MDTGLAESVNACLVCSVESMLKLFFSSIDYFLCIFGNMRGCMCSTDPFKFK